MRQLNENYCEIDRDNKALKFSSSNVTYFEILNLYESLSRNQKGQIVECFMGVNSTSALKRKLKNNPQSYVTNQEIAWIIEEVYEGDVEKFIKALRGENAEPIWKQEIYEEKDTLVYQLKEIARTVSNINVLSELEEIEHAVDQLKKIIELRKYLNE